MSPNRPIQIFKVPKACMCKNPKKALGFSRFLGVQDRPRQPLKAQEGSQEAPEYLQKLKTKSKNGPNFYQFWGILGSILGPTLAHKWNSKWDQFWNPQVPADKGSGRSENRKETRVVQKVLELEIYSPKEREG